MARRLFTAEQEEWYRANCRDMSYREQQAALREEFGIELSLEALKHWRSNHNFFGARTGQFPKGNRPYNKGMKGLRIPGSEKGWFKKGNRPHNICDIGDTAVTNGIVYRKVADNRGDSYGRKGWINVAHEEYEKAHGPVPEGRAVWHLDGDFRNNDPSNLVAIDKGAAAIANCRKVFHEGVSDASDPEIAKAILLAAELKLKTGRKKAMQGTKKK